MLTQENFREKLGLGLFVYGEVISNLFELLKGSPVEEDNRSLFCLIFIKGRTRRMSLDGWPVIMLKPEISQRSLCFFDVFNLKTVISALKQNKFPDTNWHMI